MLLHERESAYNYIQVVDEDGRRSLILNDGHAVHSIYDPRTLLTGGPWDYFMVAPLLVAATIVPRRASALLIGLAGGTVARQLTAAYGPIPITGVEIDPEIAARRPRVLRARRARRTSTSSSPMAATRSRPSTSRST